MEICNGKKEMEERFARLEKTFLFLGSICKSLVYCTAQRAGEKESLSNCGGKIRGRKEKRFAKANSNKKIKVPNLVTCVVKITDFGSVENIVEFRHSSPFAAVRCEK